MTLPTADLVEILPPAKTCFCVLPHSEMGCVKPQKCSSDGTSSICAMKTIKANPAFLDCGARCSQYRPAPAVLCQWAKYSKTIIHLIFLQAEMPGQLILAARPCVLPSPAFWQHSWWPACMVNQTVQLTLVMAISPSASRMGYFQPRALLWFGLLTMPLQITAWFTIFFSGSDWDHSTSDPTVKQFGTPNIHTRIKKRKDEKKKPSFAKLSATTAFWVSWQESRTSALS